MSRAHAVAANQLVERLGALGSEVIAGGSSFFVDGDAALVSPDRQPRWCCWFHRTPQRHALTRAMR
jgi:hypothetical protein